MYKCIINIKNINLINIVQYNITIIQYNIIIIYLYFNFFHIPVKELYRNQ